MSFRPLAIVTGATGGIGEDIARRLSAAGYRLILLGRNEAKLALLKRELPETETRALELTDTKALHGFLDEVEHSLGPIAVGIVNAGVVGIGDVVDIARSDVEAQLATNLTSAILLMQSLAKNMVTAGSGHIVGMVSMGGILALKGSATYSATKFGLRGFLAALHEELRPKGVFVSGIYPGGVDTPMLHHEAQHGGSALSFIGTPMPAGVVGKATLGRLRSPRLETYLPWSDGIFARAVSTVPWLMRWLYPLMEWLGEAGRRRYLKRLSERGIDG